jgi:spore coat protein H
MVSPAIPGEGVRGVARSCLWRLFVLAYPPMRTLLLLSAMAALSAALPLAGAPNPLGPKAPQTPADLFKEKTVWTIHLRFTPEQFNAMEPGGANGFERGAARRMGPDGLADALAAAFMKDGDGNHDGKLSKEEFAALAAKWFADWDAGKNGSLTAEQLRTGVSLTTGLTDSRLQGPDGKRNGLASAAGIEFVYVHADLEIEGQTIKNVGVRYKGNGTWMNSQNTAKHSMKIDFNHFTPGQSFAGLGKLNLHNNIIDPSFMNEPLSHKLYRDAGVASPRTAYAKVFVSVEGRRDREYLGLYSIVEDIDRHFEQEVLKRKDGALFKPVTPDLFGDMGDDWAKYKQTYDPKTDLYKAQSQRIIDFAKLVSHADDKEFAAKVGDFLDLDEFARYMSVTVWLSTLDSILAMGQNFYVYLDPKTNKFQFLPWDMDHSFGHFALGGGADEREELSIRQPWKGRNRFLERVFKVEAFRKLYLAKFEEFNKTIFVPQRFVKQVDEFAAAIRPGIREESASLLDSFDSAVAGEETINGRDSEGKPIKTFAAVRAASVTAQIAGSSQGMILRNSGRNPFGGPGASLASSLFTALDADQDSEVSRAEFVSGLRSWFAAWDTEKTGSLSAEQVKMGIYRDLFNFHGGGRRLRE